MDLPSPVKNHPVLFGGVAIGAILLVIVMRSGAGATSISGADGNDLSSAEAVQAAQLSAQTQIQGASIAAGVRSEEIAGQIELAKIAAQTSTNANQLSAQLGLAQISAALQATTTHDTLAAQIAMGQTEAQTRQAEITTNGYIQSQKTLADALVAVTQSNNQVNEKAIKCANQGFFSKLFGGC